MRLRVLGPLDLSVGGRPVPLRSAKQRILLAVLVSNGAAPTAIRPLIDALWDAPPPSARENLRVYVYHLRRALGGADRVVRHPAGYSLTIGPGELDADTFVELAAEGAAAMAAGDAAGASAVLTEALALWRGPAYGSLAANPAVMRAAVRLEDARLRATELRVHADLELGRHEDVIGELSGLVTAHPERERLRAHLMLALYRAGRRAEALRAYRDGWQLAVTELGLEPGRELQELHEAMLRGDVSLGLVTPAPAAEPAGFPRPAQLPHDIPDFVGRQAELAELDQVLDARSALGVPAFLGVTGMGGIGKTGLAIHWAHRVADRFPDGQLYADLRGYTEGAEPLTPNTVVDRFLRALGVPGAKIPADLDERAGLLRSVLAGRRVLMMVDNARDAAQVRPLLPGAAGCALVLTSRDPMDGLIAQEGAHILRLDTLPPDAAVAVLAGIAGPRVAPDDPDLARLGALCAGLPLALRIVGARLAGRSQPTAASLVALLADENRRLAELSHGGVQVRAHFELSYRALPAVSAGLFRRLGLLDGADFPAWAGAALLDTDRDRVRVMLEQLVDAQLLEVGAPGVTGETRYRLHDLVRLYARERVLDEEDEAARTAAVRRVLGGWLALAEQAHSHEYGGDYAVIHSDAARWLPDPRPDRLIDPIAWFAAERAGLVAAVAAAAGSGAADLAWDLAMTCVTLFEAHSLFDDWRQTHEIALAAAQRTGDRRGQAAMRYGLGSLALYRQDYESAAAHLGAARELFAETGDEHGDALALRNLALLYRTTGRLSEAQDAYERARELLAAHGDRAAEAHVLIGLAQTHLDQGDLSQAEHLLGESRRIFEEIGNRRGQAQVLFRIGETYLRRKQAEDAHEAFAAALPLVRALGDQVGEAYLLRGLGMAQVDRGLHEDARESMTAAVRLALRAGDQFTEAAARLGLGTLGTVTGDFADAERHLERAIGLFEAMGNVPWLGRALNALAVARQGQGDVSGARELWERALAQLTAIGSPEAAEVAAHLRSVDRP